MVVSQSNPPIARSAWTKTRGLAGRRWDESKIERAAVYDRLIRLLPLAVTGAAILCGPASNSLHLYKSTINALPQLFVHSSHLQAS
jgi:hypothetical protein